MHRHGLLGEEEPWWELAWWWTSLCGGHDMMGLSLGMWTAMGSAGMGDAGMGS